MADEHRPESATEKFWDVHDLSRRLHRIEGQVRGLEALVTRGAECEAILTQLRAVQGALDAIGRIVEMCRTADRIETGLGGLDPESIRRALMSEEPPPSRAPPRAPEPERVPTKPRGACKEPP